MAGLAGCIRMEIIPTEQENGMPWYGQHVVSLLLNILAPFYLGYVMLLGKITM